MRQRSDIAVVFMVEPGHYEWPAFLLAASLRAFSYENISLYAYCRAHLIEQLHPETLRFFDKMGVKLAPITPEFEVIYPQGNKLYACAAQRPEPATVLLDTDMFFLRPFMMSDTIFDRCVTGRPTGSWMWGKTVEDWAPAYASVGLETPSLRMVRPNGQYVPPSVSAGYVGYCAPDFGKAWVDVALEIERKRLARGIYPTLDQISLPVATFEQDLNLRMIEGTWNFATKNFDHPLQQVIGYHYQKADWLKQTQVIALADTLIEEFTIFENFDVLVEYYEHEANRPTDVIHNEGFWDTVIAPQRKVDIKHQP